MLSLKRVIKNFVFLNKNIFKNISFYNVLKVKTVQQ